MANNDLRRQADELEKRLEEGRPDRHQARLATVGRLMTTGRLPVTKSMITYTRERLEEQVAERAQQDLKLFDNDVLEHQGYRCRDQDGALIGPGSWPQGAPPRLGSALSWEGASAGRGGDWGSGGSSAPVSRSEARRQVRVSREYAAWSAGMREYRLWQESQEGRAWVFGQFFGEAVISSAEHRAIVQQEVSKEGKADQIELWSDEDLRADYTADELGEGGRKDPCRAGR